MFYICAEEHFKVLLYTYPKVGIPVRYRYSIHTYTVPYKCTETKQIIIFWFVSGNVPDRESLLEDEHQGNQDQDPVLPHSEKPESIVLDGI
jgi:hypothetical protein